MISKTANAVTEAIRMMGSVPLWALRKAARPVDLTGRILGWGLRKHPIGTLGAGAILYSQGRKMINGIDGVGARIHPYYHI